MYWINDPELIYPVKEGATFYTYRFNVDTCVRDRFTLLPANANLFAVLASPDGCRLLSMSHDFGGDGMYVNISRFDGSQHLKWRTGGDTEYCWSGDGRSVIGLVPDRGDWFSQAIVRSVAPQGKAISFAVPKTAAWNYGRPIVSRTGHLLGYAPPVTANGRQEMTVYDAPFKPGAAAKAFKITAPAGTAIFSVVFSPMGDRILWVFRTENRSSISRVIHRIIPGIPTLERFRISKWVSRIDGSDMKEVGLLERTDKDYFSTPPQVEWLPGGKSFMFRDGGAYWVVRL